MSYLVYRQQGNLTEAKLKIAGDKVDTVASDSLKKAKLRSKNDGSLSSAAISAGYHAKKLNKTMYGYMGDSYGHSVWRVSYKPGDYLSPINNSGKRLFSVTPDLTLTWHELE